MQTKDFQQRSLLGIFLRYFKPHLRLFLLDMSCAFLVSAIDLAFPLVTRNALYELLPGKEYKVFFVIMAVMFLCYLLRSFLQFVIAYWGHTFGIRVEADIRRDLFSHLQSLSFSYYDQNRTGQLMSRLTSDLFEITELAHHGPEDLFTSVLTVIGAIIIMFTVQWKLALVVCLMFPVCMSVIILRRRKMSKVSKMVKQRTAGINADIESSLSGFRTSKAFANEGAEYEKFVHSNERFKISKREFHKEMGIFHASMEFFTSILNVVVIALGGWLIMKEQMDYRDIITFSLYVGTFVNPIRKIAALSEMLANGFAGLHRFAEVMRTEPSVQDAPGAVELSSVRGALKLEHVNFSYKEELPVLKDVSLDIPAGETVAVVGPSGGGKTTLCQLIPRFYEATGGTICVDGLDIRSVTQRSLRSNIGIVQQDVFLFADTVLENIRYGRPGASFEDVVEAAKRAEIYEDIMHMPDGFDTYVGERGTLLSGGQKQRISIARIFLKNPPILILDEATSALDSITEAKIQKAFDALAKGRTTLIIAHRLSTIHAAHRVIVIADGVIREQGTREELLAREGVFAQLYRTQNLVEGCF
ncbi:MAG: ABC transporter ATP-binding protein [Oscillospiraceae bacterium]|nr:ABC transporter ATP-binding protein [Oscillospiraceae bacterium]